jgi:hypothetical protein
MWTYNQEIDPPAPFIEIAIHHPENLEQVARLQAKIDTGADISAIPAPLVSQLRLSVASKIMIEGYNGVAATMPSYNVLVEVAGIRFKNCEVIDFPDPYVLLGRDILNHFYVQLNGPELTFSLSLTPL